MWSASESGMGFCGTVCLAPCACSNETADRQSRAKAGTRNERRKRRLAMENSLTCQYREQIRSTQCKSTGASPLWTTLGKTRVRMDILTYAGPVQSALRGSLPLNMCCHPENIRCHPERSEGSVHLRHQLQKCVESLRMTGSSLSCALLAACIVLTATAGLAQEKRADEITVSAASDLSIALKEIGDSYEKKTSVKVNFSFGASGPLPQQIQ